MQSEVTDTLLVSAQLPSATPSQTHQRGHSKGPGHGNRTGSPVTRWQEALERSSEDKTHLMGQRTRGRTSDWTGTVPERSPWVSATREPHLRLVRSHPGNLTEAETTVPQNQRLQCT